MNKDKTNIVLKASNVSFAYREKNILSNITLEIKKGNFIGILGPNGAGKTTLINLFNRFLNPQKGNISLYDREISEYTFTQIAQEIATVPQSLSINFSYKVIELVLMARHPYLNTFSLESETDIEIAMNALKMVDAEEFSDRYFNELSGGEKQRVLIARALAQQTDLLLLDEPTSSLDLRHQYFIQKLLDDLNKNEGKTIVMVSHDINLTSLFCNKIILIKKGKIIKEGDPKEVITKEIINDVYEIDIETDTYQNGKPFIRFR